MWRKIGIGFFWAVLIGYLVFAIRFTHQREERRLCTTVHIVITDSAMHRFIQEEDIYKHLEPLEQSIIGHPLESVNTLEIEQWIQTYPPVAGAEVYKTPDGIIHVEVRQKIPVLRVINRFNESYYIDSQGRYLALVNHYTPHLIVASGYINQMFPHKSLSDSHIQVPEQSGERQIIFELYQIAQFLNGHPFWNAQIQQIYVREDQDLELIPRMGNHIIVFGEGINIETKFKELELLYQNALNIKGWDTYHTLNVKYENQIVCSRRETVSITSQQEKKTHEITELIVEQ